MWPSVVEPDKIRFDVHADIPASKENAKFIKELPRNAIIRKYLSNGREFITCDIYKTPIILKYLPDAYKTLELSINLRFGDHEPIVWAFGTFEQVEKELTLWLDSAQGTKHEVQERGDFVSGCYFTKETFIFAEPSYNRRSKCNEMIIIPISRTALSNIVMDELKKIRALLGGEE
jgi:hypothetical protein